MANTKEVSTGVEWRVTVPDGSTMRSESESRPNCAPWRWLVGVVIAVRSKMLGFMKKAWNMAIDDPRKVIHGAKVGIALSLVSLFYYTRPLYDGVGGTAMWAIMTVVVIFEFTVGGCLYKGFNRTTATLTAGILAISVHWIANKYGKTAEPVILSASVFLLASAASFSRFIPEIKARYDYGITIFILTFSLVTISGYRVDELMKMAQQRLSTIVIGVVMTFLVCILFFPVWAGEDLHLLIIRNMEKLADSLEGFVEEYFNKDDGSVSKEENPTQKSQSYKCVLNSKASEDSLANLARWEPAHGRFAYRHPWSQYLKIGAAMRYSAYCIEALNSCINSEIQAPEFMKKHLSDVCTRLSLESSKVLKESASSIKTMKRSRSIDFLVGEMNNTVHELHGALRALPSNVVQQLAMEAMPLLTVVSLLVKISVRVEGVVDAVDSLASLARFKPADDDKPERTGGEPLEVTTVVLRCPLQKNSQYLRGTIAAPPVKYLKMQTQKNTPPRRTHTI